MTVHDHESLHQTENFYHPPNKMSKLPTKGGQLPLLLLTSPKWKTPVTYTYTYTSTFDDADIQDSKILKFEFLKNENSF